jgi:triacylglycerol lipase
MNRIVCIFTLFISISSFSKSNEVIVLIPGAASSGTQIYVKNISKALGFIAPKQKEYFKNIRVELEKNAFNTYYCIKDYDRDRRSVVDRSKECNKNLLKLIEQNPKIRFNLLGHSMGGLVAREVFQNPLIAGHIKSITTISTPHKGSMLAHYVMRKYRGYDPIALFLKSIDFTPKKKYLKDLRKRLYSQRKLSNKESKIAFSILNYKTNWYNTPLEVTSKIIQHEIKKFNPNKISVNDGIIETSSMSYGKVLAIVEADHMESVCILYSKDSIGCKEVKTILINHYKKLTYKQSL